MPAEIVKIQDPGSSEGVARAADAIRAGQLVGLPTETVYGLAANALDEKAVAKVFRAKGRPANNPLIVHVLDAKAAKSLCREWTDAAERLATAFWPGPLTLVLPRAEPIPDVVTAGGPTVALRAPSHDVARAILAAARVPIAAPSANRSNHVSPTTAAHVAADLGDRIDLIIDGGPCSVGVESTVVDLSGGAPRVLRSGGIDAEALRSIVPDLQVAAETTHAASTPALSPGLLARHYAPDAVLELASPAEAGRRAEELAASHRVGWLTWGDEATPSVERRNVQVVVLLGDAKRYASRLYAALRRLEQQGCERIVVSTPPDGEAWRAVRDRLTRAASPRAPSRAD